MLSDYTFEELAYEYYAHGEHAEAKEERIKQENDKHKDLIVLRVIQLVLIPENQSIALKIRQLNYLVLNIFEKI